MKLWRAPTGDLVVDIDKLIGLKVVVEGSGANKRSVLYGITNTRDIEMLRTDDVTAHKAYVDIVGWVAPPPGL